MVKLQMSGDQFSITLPKIEVQKAGWKKQDKLRVVFNERTNLMEIEKMS